MFWRAIIWFSSASERVGFAWIAFIKVSTSVENVTSGLSTGAAVAAVVVPVVVVVTVAAAAAAVVVVAVVGS